jgi:hypothetical protein
VEPSLFDDAADALRGLAPPPLGQLRVRPRRYGLKAWYDSDHPPRDHYEAQVIAPRFAKGANVLALEVGFHSEYPELARNEAVMAALRADEERWRPILGGDAVVGPFLGRPEVWRRVSETWPDPDLGDPALPVEIAVRLIDYVTALEPLRRTV